MCVISDKGMPPQVVPHLYIYVGRPKFGTQVKMEGGKPPQPVLFVLTTATFAFLFLERTERSVPPSSFMVSFSLASLQSHGDRVRGEHSPNLSPPLPHQCAPFPSPSQPGHSPLFPFPWHGAGHGLRPQAWGHGAGSRVRTAEEGARARLPPAPLPLPRGRWRREPPGPAGKMADGPGWPVTRGSAPQPAIPGPSLEWGRGPTLHLWFPLRSSPALGPGLPQSPFSTSP